MNRLWIFAMAALGCAAPVPAPLFEANPVTRFQLRPQGTESARVQLVDVAGQPFSKAIRIQTLKRSGSAPAPLVVAPIEREVEAGDIAHATFWVRTVETTEPSGEASLSIRYQPPLSPWSHALNMPAPAKSAWQKFEYPFTIRRSAEKGQAELAFTFGPQPQTVEIGGIAIVNYGKSRRISELPLTPLGYAGSEPDAPWRKAARERIEKIRKAGLTVVVKDKDGKRVRNAAVAVRMRKHAFGFGTAVGGPTLAGVRVAPEDLRKYKEHILKLFNWAVMENDLKWPQWSVVADRPRTLAAVDWLRENGILVRGLNLIWPSFRNSPAAAREMKDKPEALAKFILDHMESDAALLKGRLVHWDVINETFSNHDFMDILGRQAMVDWFKAARRGDPDVKLYINDFGIISGNDTAHQNDYAATIHYLNEMGAPLDGIGLQGHFSPRVTPPEEALRRLDRFAGFKKDLAVTEFDIDTVDERTQADYTRDYLTLTFSHPAIQSFLMWGFWEGRHWKPNGAMYRTDWSKKPNAEAYESLVLKKWWTNVAGRSDARGAYAVRGFLGDYDVEVRSGQKSKTLRTSLPAGGTTVECVLDQ
ncbi:MAG: endo-1,4-beta-xylanase [Acidobacteria bacterium]|nr:endo-1,4-beta-xylanase [Acidobacteriota bacterium]